MIHRNLTTLRFVLGAAVIVHFLFAYPAHAQQQQPPASEQQPAANPSTPQPSQAGTQTPEEKKDENQEQKTGTSNDRLFWTLPNFLTVDTEKIPPLTAGQKFKVVARSSFDYVEYPWYAFLAGISQAENSEPGYGQGAAGYGKRYGAAFADGTIENFTVGAILPSILRQDPRYYEMGKGGFWHRTGYALSRLVVTRSDSGRAEFNFSEIFGAAISAGISTYSYHPRDERNIGNTASVWGTEIGYDGVTIFVKEFWPDIHRHFSKKNRT